MVIKQAHINTPTACSLVDASRKGGGVESRDAMSGEGRREESGGCKNGKRCRETRLRDDGRMQKETSLGLSLSFFFFFSPPPLFFRVGGGQRGERLSLQVTHSSSPP